MKATRKIISLICVVLIAVSALALSGCGNSNKKFDKKKMAGTYELVEMSSGSETYSKEDLQTLKSYGLSITMEIKEDGTGSMSIYGESKEFTYDADNITVDGEKTPYTLDGNKITFEQDDTKMVFEKQ